MPVHHLRALVFVSVSALAGAGCGTVRDDLELACHSVERSGARRMTKAERRREFSTPEVAEAGYVWAALRVRTSTAQDLLQTLSTLHAGDKAGFFQKIVEERGIAPCPYVDELKASYEERVREARELGVRP